ncbi:alpha/beta hydrolase family protein [Bifidobacterium aesculapii]|uniref:alpha/beta hydrolase family protein n=1 Tax=Bifidobacterium aesculapii TaxID=1329411 RepID=UPI0006E3F54A|nr:alpha/beta hydrolase [Bifidobacterium aesculapii]
MIRWRITAQVAAAAIILLVILATLGQLMMPRWQPEPYRDHIAVAASDTAIASRTSITEHQGAYRTRTRELAIHLDDGTSVPAILREPVGAPGRRPACLFVHGSGTGSDEDFGDIANAMSSAGIVTLVPAKRTDGYTPLHRDYPRFAHDYGTAYDLLTLIPGVDPARTGLYAESEGTWISMLMTSQRRDVAFAILTSAPVYKGREQMAMAVSAYVRQAGAPTPVVKDLAKLLSLDFAPFDLAYADFDADTARASLTMPLLVNYGTYDTAMPIEQGARTIIDDAARRGNRNVTVRYYAANHQMRAGQGLFAPGLPLADGYTRDLADWVNAIAAGTRADGWATPKIAGAVPHQQYAAPRSTASGIIGSLGALAGLTVAALACFAIAAVGSAGFGVAELARRRRLAARVARGASHVAGGLRARFPAVGRKRAGRDEPDGRGGAAADTTEAWPGTSRAFLRNIGYSRALRRIIGWGVGMAVFTLLAIAAYLSYVGVNALNVWQAPGLLQAGFAMLRCGGVASAVLCAWLIVRLWHAWRIRRAYIAHGIYPEAESWQAGRGAGRRGVSAYGVGTEPHSTWIVGRWHWLVALVALTGMLLALVVMAFWGLFSL